MKRLAKNNSVDPGKLDMEKIRQIGDKQFIESSETNDPNFDEKCIYFVYKGIHIVDPFTDETGCFEVDPISYYGEDFLNSDFAKILK